MQETPTLHTGRGGNHAAPPGSPTRTSWIRRILSPASAGGPAGSPAEAGPPPLDPRAWTRRHRLLLIATLVVATAAGLVEAIQTGRASAIGNSIGAAEGLRAFLGVLCAGAMVALALSLRGVSLPGFLAGGFYTLAGIVSWTYTGTGSRLVWVVLAVEGAVFAAWTWPWLRTLRLAGTVSRMGSAWLGLGYWLLGGIAGVLVLRLGVAVGRFAYFALFALGVLAVVVVTRRTRRDLTVGVVAAFLFALAALFVAGSGNVFDDVHAVRPDAWGAGMQYRFWGGPQLLYHPNSIAVIAVVVAIRVAGDRVFEAWQRYAALGLVTLVLLLVNSRTGLLFLGVAAGLHLLLVLARRVRYPSRRAALGAVLLPIVAVLVVGVASGGTSFLFKSRYASGGVTSGRSDTWRVVIEDFRSDGIAEKLFGDAKSVRGYVLRDDSTSDRTVKAPQLTTDNAAVGALRRGGIVGCVAFLLGLGLLVWRGLRRGAPAWFTMAGIGSISTIATADWLLGNTGGTLWIFLVAGEAFLMLPWRDGIPAQARIDEPVRANSGPARTDAGP